MWNEFVHDNNGVIIPKWMWHVNKHTKKENTRKQIEGQTKCKHKFTQHRE
jgi:hypothetical protein